MIFLVFALVGNKNDLYLEEEVTDEEGLKLAKEMNAIYQRTSAKSDSGSIDELFMNIGKKILEPDSVIESNLTKAEKKTKGKNIIKTTNKRRSRGTSFKKEVLWLNLYICIFLRIIKK